MNLAKISANGQITIPIEIRRLLSLKSGDKILFDTNEDGQVVIYNASQSALAKIQRAMKNADKHLGVASESDVQTLVDNVRYGDSE